MRDSPTTVAVRLVYLARLREAFASGGETLAVPAAPTPTVGTLIDALRGRGGNFATELAEGRAVRFAVNHRVANREQALAEGDELAIFPPVTGG
jgi:molybdopterin synthase sulfur carrier subunit